MKKLQALDIQNAFDKCTGKKDHLTYLTCIARQLNSVMFGDLFEEQFKNKNKKKPEACAFPKPKTVPLEQPVEECTS